MQEQSPFASNRRAGCLTWLVAVSLLLSIISLALDITQELAWNNRMAELTASTNQPATLPTAEQQAQLPVTITPTMETSVPVPDTPIPTAAAVVISTPATVAVATVAPTLLPSATPAVLPVSGYSAPDIIHQFRAAGLPIGDVIEYTAETDPNDLLGRPNQYIQKISWKDTRVETQGEPGTSTGGTVEVFSTAQDMEARKAYVGTTSQVASFLAEYIYSNDVILVRLTHDLTPEQAKEYENVLMNLPPRN